MRLWAIKEQTQTNYSDKCKSFEGRRYLKFTQEVCSGTENDLCPPQICKALQHMQVVKRALVIPLESEFKQIVPFQRNVTLFD